MSGGVRKGGARSRRTWGPWCCSSSSRRGWPGGGSLGPLLLRLLPMFGGVPRLRLLLLLLLGGLGAHLACEHVQGLEDAVERLGRTRVLGVDLPQRCRQRLRMRGSKA